MSNWISEFSVHGSYESVDMISFRSSCFDFNGIWWVYVTRQVTRTSFVKELNSMFDPPVLSLYLFSCDCCNHS